MAGDAPVCPLWRDFAAAPATSKRSLESFFLVVGTFADSVYKKKTGKDTASSQTQNKRGLIKDLSSQDKAY